MKRRIQQATVWLVALGLWLIAGRIANAQGLINFNNYVPTANPPIDAKVYDYLVGGVPLSGTDTTLRAALLGGPTNGIPSTWNSPGNLSLLASPNTSGTWTTFRTGANAGYVAVGTDGARDSGLPYGSMGLFQLVVWHGTETTWAQAFADYQLGLVPGIGGSVPLMLKVSLGPSDTNIPNLTGLASFDFYVVPEPSTLSLMLSGAGAWMLIRGKMRGLN